MRQAQEFGAWGELYHAEADTPEGPWVYAEKIVTHEAYNFYNPSPHPELAELDGRLVFFEGSYTTFLFDQTTPTPRYDYNQIMYGLDLADSRVILPVPVYDVGGAMPGDFVLKEQLEDLEDRSRIAEDAVERMKEMGIQDPSRIYDTDDLAPGKKIIFAATGVTDGTILRGVRFFGTGIRTSSIIMATERTKRVRFVDTVHVEGGPDTVVRF